MCQGLIYELLPWMPVQILFHPEWVDFEEKPKRHAERKQKRC